MCPNSSYLWATLTFQPYKSSIKSALTLPILQVHANNLFQEIICRDKSNYTCIQHSHIYIYIGVLGNQLPAAVSKFCNIGGHPVISIKCSRQFRSMDILRNHLSGHFQCQQKRLKTAVKPFCPGTVPVVKTPYIYTNLIVQTNPI